MEAAALKKASKNKNFQAVKKFWDSFIYPRNVEVVKGKDPEGIFAENMKGRVDITRNFDGKELNIEYLFGLFVGPTTSTQFTLIPVPVNYTFSEFVTADNVASTSVIVNLKHLASGVTTPIQIDSFTRYDKDGKLAQYDAIFRRISLQLTAVVQRMAPYILTEYAKFTKAAPPAPTAENVQKALVVLQADSICNTAATSCTGALSQYSSYAECFNFLTTQIRFGTAYEGGQNTLWCRTVHQQMVPLAPEVHCPHIGKTGGGQCTDFQYEDFMIPFYDAPFIAS
ncbi:uncharacterized protein EV422DRAFT_495256 [Fimicolochytrium jonesii]|uniref:uncharacterized protein n=1 Tax=Fimicolochytrium jonesii TaxID=1396493 RepID=UPI0022FE9530|nr:uncharacterized protein EV422DRAFT_495256 [Fimicolochytrium jonesii]KAI8822012.1 hypothetical protein EV422DRAFT_495256 [Fimicolochytrium jonesii]